MRGILAVAAAIAFAFALLGYAKVVWQSGFDQGADVSLCVGESLINNGGKLATHAPSCRRAKDYEDNPLWALQRRDGGQ